jgi:hypothetical protein
MENNLKNLSDQISDITKLTPNLGELISNNNQMNLSPEITELFTKEGYSILNAWLEVFNMQISFNSKVDPNWIAADYPFDRAFRMELTEYIDSFNWEWWKKKKDNILNAEVELIDAFHFLISSFLKSYTNDNKDNFSLLGLAAYNMFKTGMKDKILNTKEGITKAEELINISFLPVKGNIILFGGFGNLWASLSLTEEDLIKLYIAKNLLNEFRQNNGYKENKYTKIWGIEEDNVFCWNFAKELPFDFKNDIKESISIFKKQLYNKLEQTYSYFNTENS